METFKQALSETMRAIAERKDLQVTFSNSNPLLKKKSSLIPLPTPAFTAAEIARSRGAADEYALRLRHHDEGIHQNLKPESGTALSIFEASEDARLAVIGSTHMRGVSHNLSCVLEERLRQQQNSRNNNAADELGEALGLLLREKLITSPGNPRPLLPLAKSLLDQKRDWLEEKLAGELDSLPDLIHDQQAFALKFRQIIELLGFQDELGPPPEEDPNQSEEDAKKKNPINPKMRRNPTPTPLKMMRKKVEARMIWIQTGSCRIRTIRRNRYPWLTPGQNLVKTRRVFTRHIPRNSMKRFGQKTCLIPNPSLAFANT